MKKRILRMGAAALIALMICTAGVPQALAAKKSKYISASKAKSIALKHAKRRSSAVRFVKIKRERDDGRMVYEVEFRLRKNRRIEYEYEIDARTGRILEWEKDYDD